MEKQQGRIYVVGLGPGDVSMMSVQASEALKNSDVIIGYRTYTELIKEKFSHKEIIESPMKGEIERCHTCLELAQKGKIVSLICSGDAGVYGMASPMLEVAAEADFDAVQIIPGISAALSGAAILGAPVAHDFCTISLSDLLTPWDVIEKRLKSAAAGDFCIVLYNPASKTRKDHLHKACEILLSILPGDRACGLIRNIGREGCSFKLCTLEELAEEEANMFTTVFIGNSTTYIAKDRLITPRGYEKR